MDKEVVGALNPNVLTPAETEAKLEGIGTKKATMPLKQSVVLGILAGLFISMGGMMLCLVLSDSTLPFAIQRVLGGLSFCIGLVLVLLSGSELFTGNNLIIAAVCSGKVSWGGYAKNLIIIWISNLVGSLIAVAIVYYSHFQLMNGGAVGDVFVTLATAKVSYDPMTLFFKGILCNFLVCLAVWMSFAGKTFVDKFFAVLFPVTAFVAAGAEHCVANMFLIPMGFFLKITGHVPDGFDASALDIAGIGYNLGLATLGNIVGGAILVGLAYWFIYHKPKQEAK